MKKLHNSMLLSMNQDLTILKTKLINSFIYKKVTDQENKILKNDFILSKI